MRNFLPAVAILVLCGCQPVTVQRNEGLVPVSIRTDDAAYWLEDWYRVLQLPDEQIKTALEGRESEFAESPNPRTRLRLTLLLAQGPKVVRNQTRALTLLKSMDKEQADNSALALAGLLEQVISEQRWSGGKITELRAELKQAETRIEELERQLQALTNIEQSIQHRD